MTLPDLQQMCIRDSYIKAQNTFPTVIKADGLALGKGVIIAQNLEEAEQAVHEMIDDGKFGKSGSRVVIEEFLTGPEVSVLAFTDGKTVKPMVSAQDHKRAYDNDEGLNTGGMGTFSPSRLYDDAKAEECMKNIFVPTIKADVYKRQVVYKITELFTCNIIVKVVVFVVDNAK